MDRHSEPSPGTGLAIFAGLAGASLVPDELAGTPGPLGHLFPDVGVARYDAARIYDVCAGAFEVIHDSLNAALEAITIVGTGCGGGSGALNAQAKAARVRRSSERASDCRSGKDTAGLSLRASK